MNLRVLATCCAMRRCLRRIPCRNERAERNCICEKAERRHLGKSESAFRCQRSFVMMIFVPRDCRKNIPGLRLQIGLAICIQHDAIYHLILQECVDLLPVRFVTHCHRLFFVLWVLAASVNTNSGKARTALKRISGREQIMIRLQGREKTSKQDFKNRRTEKTSISAILQSLNVRLS